MDRPFWLLGVLSVSVVVGNETFESYTMVTSEIRVFLPLLQGSLGFFICLLDFYRLSMCQESA